MSNLYFNEESDYPKVNRCDNEVFHSTILYQSMKLNIFHASAADLLHTFTYSVRIGNLNWCKCRYWKNEAREIN